MPQQNRPANNVKSAPLTGGSAENPQQALSKGAAAVQSPAGAYTKFICKKSLAPSFPKHQLSMILFVNVKNSADVFNLIGSGGLVESESGEVNPQGFFILVNPKMIMSVGHVVHAAHRALFNQVTRLLKTRSVQSELLFCLSASNSITDSIQLFGCSPDATEILLVAIDATARQLDELASNIDGEPEMINSLRSVTDYDEVKKHLNCMEVEISLPGGLEAAMLARIATKGL